MKMIFFLIILLYLTSSNAYSQNSFSKIDSVFSFYFKMVEFELHSDSAYQIRYPQYFDSLILKESNQVVYINKYAPGAISFLKKVTNIENTPSSHYSTKITLTQDLLDEWKIWYFDNKKRLRWNYKKKKPYVKRL